MNNKNNERFDQQDHPLKNTDRAFVQVGSRGEPVVPASGQPAAAGQEERSQPPSEADQSSTDPS